MKEVINYIQTKVMTHPLYQWFSTCGWCPFPGPNEPLKRVTHHLPCILGIDIKIHNSNNITVMDQQ